MGEVPIFQFIVYIVEQMLIKNILIIIIFLMASENSISLGIRTRNQHNLNSSFLTKIKKTKQIQKQKTKMKTLGKKIIEKTTEMNPKKQDIAVNLNLGQYGFDTVVSKASLQKIQELLQINQLFSINPNIEGISWKEFCNQMTHKMQKEGYFIQGKNNIFLRTGLQQNYIKITQVEKNIWDCMHELLGKMKEGSNFPGLFGIISEEIYNARKLLEKSSNSLQQIKTVEDWKFIGKLHDVFLGELLRKTYKYGLEMKNIDELNYFLAKQYEENNRNNNIQYIIENWEEWAGFISKKRVRLRKANKFLLHTACQLCMSSYFEQSNKITNCPECHARGHQICLKANATNRCGRCIYSRLSNEAKQKIPECFLCGISGLVPLRISSSKFAHIFCLVSHGLWKIEQEKIILNQKQQSKGKNETCTFCNRNTKYYTKCITCGKVCHYLCAFMHGANLQMVQNNIVLIQCCKQDQKQLKKLSYQRQYILNYQGIVFKKLAELKKPLGGRKRSKSKINSSEIDEEGNPMRQSVQDQKNNEIYSEQEQEQEQNILQ